MIYDYFGYLVVALNREIISSESEHFHFLVSQDVQAWLRFICDFFALSRKSTSATVNEINET